jgi:hypothetical protein
MLLLPRRYEGKERALRTLIPEKSGEFGITPT